MVYRVSLTAQARDDIADVFAYIVRAGAAESAGKWVDRIEAEIFSLDEMPRRCPVAPESEKFGIEIRQLIFGKRTGTYRIIFRVDEGSQDVHILTIRHTSRDEIKLEDIY